MALVRTSLIGYDKDGTRVFRLRSGNYIGGLFADAAEVEAYIRKYPQQQGMNPALYRRQYGPITAEPS